MSFCAFADANGIYDVTPVENLFIQEFMAHAPGEFVRVYLYGLMLCYHPSEEMSHERVAQALGLEPAEVLNAFRYWERQGALQRISDQPPAFRYVNLKAAMMAGATEDQSLYRYRSFNNRLQSLFGAERLLHPQEYQRALEWVEELKLPEEVVLRLVKSKIDQGSVQFTFASLEKTALKWAEEGIATAAQADMALERDGKAYQAAQQVLRQFNSRRAPTKDELALARKWLEEWSLSPESIIAACRELPNASNPSFGYLDKVLAGHRGAKNAKDMDRRISDKNKLRDLVKDALRALGAQQASPTDAQTAAYQRYLDAGFEHEGILSVAGQLAARGQHKPDDLDLALAKCEKLQLFTKEDIDRHQSARRARRNRTTPILEAAGLDRAPTDGDAAMIDEWLTTYDNALVEFAAQCARGTQTPLRYVDKLLKNWAKANITDAEAARREYGAKRDSSAPGGRAAAPVPAALNYQQRDYQGGELDYLFADLTAPAKEDVP